MRKATFTLRQKSRPRPLLIVSFVIFILGVVGSVSITSPVHAWCNNLDIEFSHLCVSENYDSLPSSIKGTTTKEGYVELAESCMAGNASGIDLGIRQGGCADAAASCLSHIVNPEYCKGDVMASMVGGFLSEDSIFGGSCNDGKLTGNGDQDCSPLAKANKAAIDADTDAVVAIAKGACTIPTTGSEADKTRAAEACTKPIEEACTKPALNNNGTLKNEADYISYKSCLSNALLDNAKDGSECKDRGGIWQDNETGSGGNTVDIGCYNKYEDLINPEACKAAGGVWLQDPSDKSHWECNEAAISTYCEKHDDLTLREACQAGLTGADCSKFATQREIDACEDGKSADEAVDGGVAEGPTQKINKVNDKCGEARVNVLVCGSAGGNAALNNILKIAVIILSIIVGIAAVGGLAWASILYSKAEENEGSVSEAKTLIQNIVIGLLLYVLLVGLINWLVPGGVF